MSAANPSIAMGLSGIADWSAQHPFLDRFKTSREWVVNSNTQWGLDLPVTTDANGWPKGIPAGATALTTVISVDPLSEWSSGRYVVLYDGKGTISYSLGTTRIDSQSQAGRDVVTVRNQNAGEDFQAMFLNITATNAADPIRNIRVVREDQLSLFQNGEIFNPEFLEKNQDWRTLRYMDWMATNGSDIATWADRPTLNSSTWATKGVPIEIIVELANRTGTDPWINVPHKATDAHVQALAAYLRDHLDPRLKVHVEYSNEVWNWGFEQASYADEQAQKLWARDLNRNGRIDEAERIGDGWVQYYGARASQVMNIFDAVFGATADARLEKIMAVQTAWLGLSQSSLNAPNYVAQGNKAPYLSFDSYAVAGYFDGGLYSTKHLQTVLLWAKQGEAGMAKAFRQLEFGDVLKDPDAITLQTLKTWYDFHQKVAASKGLDLVMYESGAHLVSSMFTEAQNAVLTEFFGRLQRDKRMGELFEKNIALFKAEGGKLFNSFTDAGDNGPSIWGYWSALDSIYDNGSARWDALKAWNLLHPGSMDGRDATAFANGKFIAGTNAGERFVGGNGGDNIRGQGGNDTLISLLGKDRIDGGAGDDRIMGGGGGDRLSGGAGTDTFYFTALSDSRIATVDRDLILDFARNIDHILLSTIDANTRIAGNQSFEFIGTGAFTGNAADAAKRGEVRYQWIDKPGTADDRTMLYLDVNGDRRSDMAIELVGRIALSAGDFYL